MLPLLAGCTKIHQLVSFLWSLSLTIFLESPRCQAFYNFFHLLIQRRSFEHCSRLNHPCRNIFQGVFSGSSNYDYWPGGRVPSYTFLNLLYFLPRHHIWLLLPSVTNWIHLMVRVLQSAYHNGGWQLIAISHVFLWMLPPLWLFFYSIFPLKLSSLPSSTCSEGRRYVSGVTKSQVKSFNIYLEEVPVLACRRRDVVSSRLHILTV